jgi:hypothetical protein
VHWCQQPTIWGARDYGVRTMTGSSRDKISDIEAAVEFIKKRLRPQTDATLDAAMEIGQHILDNFFGGDILFFGNKARASSFRQLVGHDALSDFGLGRQALANYVKVADLQRSLPKEAQSLGLSARVKLTRARKPRDMRAIAVIAAKEKWSARKIEEEVKRHNTQDRKPKPVEQLPDGLRLALQVLASAKELSTSYPVPKESDDHRHMHVAVLRAIEKLKGVAADLEHDWQSRPDADTIGSIVLLENCTAPKALELLGLVLGTPLELPLERDNEELLAALKRARHRITHILEKDPPQKAIHWVKQFVSDLCDAADLETPPVREPEVVSAVQPIPKGKSAGQRWFGIFVQQPATPVEAEPADLVEMLVQEVQREPASLLCLMTATDPAAAEQEFLSAAGNTFASDTICAVRVDETRLKKILARKLQGVGIDRFMALRRDERLPTMDEFLREKSKEEGNTK